MRPLLLGISVLLGLCSTAAIAGDGGWFGESCISYWGDACERQRKVAQVELDEEEPESIRGSDALPFSWDSYQDPTQLVFWDDGGEWQPSRPFMELVRDPSPENMRRYRRWTEDKAQVAADLQRLLAIDVAATGPRVPTPVLNLELEEQVLRDVSPALDWSDVRIVYFYQSSCPYCQRSVAVVDQLLGLGARVVPVFLDAPSPAHPDSVPYDDTMRSVFRVESTPTWVVQVGGRRGAIEGFASLAELRKQVQGLAALKETK